MAFETIIHPVIMIKKTLLIAALLVSITACNMNPNKEERLQKLETEIAQSQEQIKALETRVQTLERENEALQKRILAFEEP
ncbi:hypothetical protein [Robiginitalea aurantiaca]|nr:hypothetical protein [Robiginitalea aurantiaca]